MQLHFIGTGAGCPTPLRNVASMALQMPEHGGMIWLFDCGEGTQHRIHSSSLRLTKLDCIFITHLHGDHIFGLPGILSSRSSQGSLSPLTIYGPQGITKFVRTIMQVSSTRLRYELDIIEWKDGDTFQKNPFNIQIAELEHGIPSFGIRLDEYPIRTGSLNTQKLAEHGIKEGPVYGQFKTQELINLPDGRQFKRIDFLLPAPKPRTLVICGDTRPSNTTIKLAKKANILVHEATYKNQEIDKAKRFYHTTSSEAASLAKDTCTETLILTHLSARYDEHGAQELVSEAKKIFPNTILAKDGFIHNMACKRCLVEG